MTKSTRNLMVLVGAVTILTLALFAVGPVLAQSGTTSSGQNAQGSNTVVVSTNETLGTLVARYNLSGTNLRDFLSANSNLPLVPGQRVVFPAGFNANIPTTGQGTNSSQGQGTTGSSTAAATSSSGSSSSGASSTGTPMATSSASGTSSSSSSSSSSTTSKAQTYVVQPGDTLGTILNMMGFQASTGAGTSGAAATVAPTTAATMAATVAPTTAATMAATVAPTTAATMAATVAPTTAATAAATTASGGATAVATSASGAATTVVSTSTPVATTAATTAAVSTSTPVATTAASSSGSSTTTSTVSGPTDAQLTQFVRANSTLRFGLVVSLPAGIPATGGNNQTGAGTPGASGTSGSTGTTGTGTTGTSGRPVGLAGLSGKAASDFACSTSAPKGFGYYKVRGGDTLQSISTKFGVSVARILELNSGSAFAKGNIILLPGVEAPGAWDVKAYCPSGGTTTKSTSGSAGGVATVVPSVVPSVTATSVASPVASPVVTATP